MTGRQPCMRCDHPGEHSHHLTLRDEQGARLDDDLVVWLCRACHLQAHAVLRIWELERAAGALTVVERVELRLRRVAAFLTCLDQPWRTLASPLAAAMRRWADDLAAHTRRLDQRYPHWRTDLA